MEFYLLAQSVVRSDGGDSGQGVRERQELCHLAHGCLLGLNACVLHHHSACSCFSIPLPSSPSSQHDRPRPLFLVYIKRPESGLVDEMTTPRRRSHRSRCAVFTGASTLKMHRTLGHSALPHLDPRKNLKQSSLYFYIHTPPS